MSAERIEVRPAHASPVRVPPAAFLLLALAIPLWFGLFVLPTRSFGPALLLAGVSLVLIAALLGYVRWVLSSSFMRWDGTELVVHEGLNRWRMRPQAGLSSMTARVKIGGRHSTFYLWVLDGSQRPLVRLKVNLWPKDELRSVLETIGIPPPDLTEPSTMTTIRKVRNQDAQLLPALMSHQTGLIVFLGVVAIVMLAAIF